MKKNLLLIYLLLIAITATGQQLVPGSTDIVGLSGYPSDPHLVEADAQSFFWVSGSSSPTAVNHPLLTEVFSEYSNIYFIKYDREGVPLKSNYIRGVSRAENAFSFEGGLTVMAKASEDVYANGQVLPIGGDNHLEFIATYDPNCQLIKIINIWDLDPGMYVYSDAIMDPKDGSVYIYGKASAPMVLLGYGTLGKDLSPDYFYLVKYNRNLELEWAYTAGFDMVASGTSPYFNKINIHPGNDGTVLVTGSYGTESSPLINDISLPAYMDTHGMFAVMLNAAGSPRWVQDGPMNGNGYQTAVFEAYPMPNGDFVLAGVTNTGYFKLGNAEISFPGGANFENQFVYRMGQNGDFIWGRPIQNMRPNVDKKKKGAQSEVFQAYLNYDAINWRNKFLYMTGFFNTTTGFSIAGRTLDHTYGEGIFVVAIDMEDGAELWGYGLTSDYLNLYGFDSDRSGNVSLMGYNYMTQDLEGITEVPVGVTSFLFHVGLDYNGKALWYNNANLLIGPYYYRLNGVDLEVLPNGEVFSSMYMTEANSLVIGSAVLPASGDTYSSWLVELTSNIIVGGLVTDVTGSPVYPGLVRAIKSAPWGGYPVVDSTLINDDGSYQFTDLYPGIYAFQAMTDLGLYPNGIPTYCKNSVEWQTARFFGIAPDTNATYLNIELVEIPKFTSGDGSGEMSGTISTEDVYGLKGTHAHPAKKTAVILLKKSKKSTNAGEVVAYAETDETGMFVFDNVPDGDYILIVDVAGLEMLNTHEVTIAGNQIVSGLNYTVSDDGIYAGWPVGVSFLENKTLNIWPNPGEGLIMMDLPAAGDYVVRIYAADGRMIRTDEFRSAGGVTTLNISGENKGLYILSIEGPETKTTRKYIKK